MDRRISQTLTSDPVVRVKIISAGGAVMDSAETGVAKACLNPIWNAVFSFELQHTEVKEDGKCPMLDVTVEDWDLISSNDFLGHVAVPLSGFYSKLRQRRWYALLDEVTGPGSQSRCGEIELAVRWVHNPALVHFNHSESYPKLAPNELRIMLVRARGLLLAKQAHERDSGKTDPFVRFHVGAQSWTSTQTKCSLHPIWHELCVIPVHACDGARALLEITVESSALPVKYCAELKLQSLLSRRSSGNLQPLQMWFPLIPADVGAMGMSTGLLGEAREVEMILEWIHNPPLSFYDMLDDDKSVGPPNLLHVAVVQARGLHALQKVSLGEHYKSDPYVLIKRKDQRIACSSVLSCTRAPVWRETFVFPLSVLARKKKDMVETRKKERDLIIEVLHHDMSESECELLGCCSVDILTELAHRRPCRSWRQLYRPSEVSGYPQTCGEIEVEFRWVHDRDTGPSQSEPLYRVHMCNMSAVVLRSQSDSVLEGAAHLGVRANLMQPVTTIGAELSPDTFFVSVKLHILSATIYLSEEFSTRGVFVIVKCNGREIYRTHTRYTTQSLVWSYETCGARIQLPSPGSSTRPHAVSVELWGADEYSAKRHFFGEVLLTSVDLLNNDLQDRKCEYKLAKNTRGVPLCISGKMILMWKPIPSINDSDTIQEDIAADVSLGDFHGTELITNGHLGGNDNESEPVCEFPYTIYIANLTVNGFKELVFDAKSDLRGRGLFVCASLGGDSATSTVLEDAERNGEWLHDILQLRTRASCLCDASMSDVLYFELKSKHEAGQETLVGRCALPIQAQWADGVEPHRVLQALSHPQASKQQGNISFNISIKCRHSQRSKSIVAVVAEDEHRRLLAALDRSAEYAMRAARDALQAVERASDFKERTNLRSMAAISRREAERAKKRFQAGKALEPEILRKRAERRLGRLDAISAKTLTRTCSTTATFRKKNTIIGQDVTQAVAFPKIAETPILKQRELAHVNTAVRIDPRERLGIIWGEVDEDEIAALSANCSGFLPPHPSETFPPEENPRVRSTETSKPALTSDLTYHSDGHTPAINLDIFELDGGSRKDRPRFLKWPHISRPPPQKKKIRNAEKNDEEHILQSDVKPGAECIIESLDGQIKELDANLGALTTLAKARTRALATHAGQDMTILGLRKDMQAARLGVQVGWRAVALNGEGLRCREQLVRSLKSYVEMPPKANAPAGSSKGSEVTLVFTRRIEWRRERERLRKAKRSLTSTKRIREDSMRAATFREKFVSLDLRKPVGIVWTAVKGDAYGHQDGHLEVRPLSTLQFQIFTISFLVSGQTSDAKHHGYSTAHSRRMDSLAHCCDARAR